GGLVSNFGDLEFLAGGTTVERIGPLTRLYEGLPPYMLFAAPSGFLGRRLAAEAAHGQAFPLRLEDWQDDHRVACLFTQVKGPPPLAHERGRHRPGRDVRVDGQPTASDGTERSRFGPRGRSLCSTSTCEACTAPLTGVIGTRRSRR
ncbi:hypothetical protein ABXN37_28945, partial [Piscinibacter sakaiensis]